jgi:hypothetical protein
LVGGLEGNSSLAILRHVFYAYEVVVAPLNMKYVGVVAMTMFPPHSPFGCSRKPLRKAQLLGLLLCSHQGSVVVVLPRAPKMNLYDSDTEVRAAKFVVPFAGYSTCSYELMDI